MTKIKRIKFYNHKILGDLELDFCDLNGKPYNNIIFAGENGSGKSTVLNTLFSIFDNQNSHILICEKVEIDILISDKQLSIITDESITSQNYIKDGYVFGNEVKLIITPREGILAHAYKNSQILTADMTKYLNLSNRVFGGFSEDIFKVLYSDVEVNYNPKSIKSTSSSELDVQQENAQKSTEDLATEITQLIVDIEAMDNSDYVQWAKENSESKVVEGILDKRMSRFKTAFDYMFDSKKYKRVETRNGERVVLFEENGIDVSINNLSSGEKQIVFRGSFLLRNKLANESAIVLIDEPEISLHPKWQQRILKYYKKLFTNEAGVQDSQMFYVTHSPFVIHDINGSTDKIIILEKMNGKVIQQESPKYYGWTEEEAVKQAFNINLAASNEKTVVYVEGITDEIYYKKAFEIHGIEQTNLEIKWIGRDEKGHKFTGDSALNQAREYLLSNVEEFSNRYILVYDSDITVKEQDYTDANVFIRQAAINEEATIFKKGTENMLEIPGNFDLEKFYIEKTNQDGYGGSSKSLNKTALCDYICFEAQLEEQKIWFSKFMELVINKIEHIAVGERS